MLFESQHPLVKHKLTLLRHVDTKPKQFRELVRELTQFLGYEATQDLSLAAVPVPTPMGEAPGHALQEQIGLVPILRAGLGMVDALLEHIPAVQVWHLGMYRDEETLEPVSYYNKLPPQTTVDTCLVLDPMLATGGSAIATVTVLKRWGVKRIKFLGLIAAPEGVKALQDAFSDVDIHVAVVDERLNDIGFIVPGLGDAGDRQFGTFA